ncbi:MAG: carboxypeptidase-like regulatory domain-containing protein, partial [Duncaniella sp.]|nr:carboxypeptidase-like regulatory domain-containing protein [Duncaniella sp.]
VIRVTHNINLNFGDGLLITHYFERLPDGTRLKLTDDMIIEASLMPGTPSIYARRNTVYTGHNFEPADDPKVFDRGLAQIYDPLARSRKEDFWQANRTTTISHGEHSMEQMMARLRKDPIYYWGEKIFKTFTSGYATTGNPSKFDIGPLTSSFSTNSVEGLRLRAGGMTTAALSRRWFGRGYVAHGFKDHRWKYSAEAEYSFIDKAKHSREFPVKSLRLTHRYDMNMLGQHFTSNNQDNMFLSFKRMEDLQMTYERLTKLEWIMEMENNFSVTTRIANTRQEPTVYMPFVNGHGERFGHYTLNSLAVELRYAPGEKFYQMKTGRLPINFDAPIWTLTHEWAPRSLAGNPFAVAKTEVSFSKRWWFSAFGYTDVFIKGGHVWTRSPYPNLLIPNANLSFFYQVESFSCLNPMEFINDSYLQWDLTYWANGALLNCVPLLKKLKLRECVLVRGLSGHLSRRNRPWENPSLYAFPAEAHTVVMSKTPYLEAGVGVDNLLKVLRVDYTWRLTYRNDPMACRGGVRFMFHFSF